MESGIYCSQNLGSQHTFERRFIRNEIMKEQMDSIVREGFDSHIDLVWSTSRDLVVEYRLADTSSP
ncbi:uncharacterized protein P174DRAFT_445008 [Aspergillus novofumigatus IBT 16806]|uniref:Uncharacterized protein n=1 Tax=Aspergillus novofumigatus (strain IBT 16806) TaxID=1392255 RepID=A0A2I1BX51_ASPN1|nr:uncharacterized protein P174DRAFT_445008 [Aspergillus novofumigatus IBT 16806]PKX89952.1 hypothetical protein P174DRAFT_445008 [Aspergillus novofumigatus IBT 16806]